MTSLAADRPQAILERFFSGAIVRGERVVAITRLVLASLFLAEWLLFGDVLGPTPGSPTYWIGVAGMTVGIGYSVWTLRWLRAPRRLGPGLTLSVCVDALIIAMIVVPQVVWPVPGWPGIVQAPDLAVLLVAIVAAGLRLSRGAMLVGAGLLLGLYGAVVGLQVAHGPRILHAGATATWTLILAGAAVMSYFIATRTRRLVFEGAEAALSAERARQRFGAYVSEEIAREALEAEEITLGGRRQSVAVLFSDLRGFTGYAETVPPEQLVGELNAYLDAMVRVIRDEGGVVDKFIGDAIMVVFGIPRPEEDDARRAIRAAAAMQAALEQHNRDRAARDRPPLQHGIGVHYGPAVAGHVGTAERLQFTVVGDVVNLASRLESATKQVGAAVLVSEAAVRAAGGEGHPPVARHGPVQVPGHQKPIEVFTLRGP